MVRNQCARKDVRVLGRKTQYDAQHDLPFPRVNMALIARERSVGPVTLLELSERLTIEHVPELRDRIDGLAARGRRLVLLDCGRISVIDSQGIGGLVKNWLSLKKHGGSLKLLNPSYRLKEVLQLIGLQKVIECFDDIGIALRSF